MNAQSRKVNPWSLAGSTKTATHAFAAQVLPASRRVVGPINKHAKPNEIEGFAPGGLHTGIRFMCGELTADYCAEAFTDLEAFACAIHDVYARAELAMASGEDFVLAKAVRVLREAIAQRRQPYSTEAVGKWAQEAPFTAAALMRSVDDTQVNTLAAFLTALRPFLAKGFAPLHATLADGTFIETGSPIFLRAEDHLVLVEQSVGRNKDGARWPKLERADLIALLAVALAPDHDVPVSRVGVFNPRNGTSHEWPVAELVGELSNSAATVERVREGFRRALASDVSDPENQWQVNRREDLGIGSAWWAGLTPFNPAAVRAESLNDLSLERQLAVLRSEAERILRNGDLRVIFEQPVCKGSLPLRDPADQFAFLGSDGFYHQIDSRTGACRDSAYRRPEYPDRPLPVGARHLASREAVDEWLGEFVSTADLEVSVPHVVPHPEHPDAFACWVTVFDDTVPGVLLHDVPVDARCCVNSWPSADYPFRAKLETAFPDWDGLCFTCGEAYPNSADIELTTGRLRGALCWSCHNRARACLHVAGCPFGDHMDSAPITDRGLASTPLGFGKIEASRMLEVVAKYAELAPLKDEIRERIRAKVEYPWDGRPTSIY